MRWQFHIKRGVSLPDLIDEPIGWNEATLVFKRDKDLHGIFFEYSFPVKFYGEAFTLIKNVYDTSGVEGEILLIVDFACSDTDAFEEFYRGRLNLTKIKFEESEVCLVEIPVEDDTCLALFKNRQDQDVDLASLESLDGTALDDYEALSETLQLTPKTILKTDRFGYDDETLIDGETEIATITDNTPGAKILTTFIWTKPPDVIDEIRGYSEDFTGGGGTDTENDVEHFWDVPYLVEDVSDYSFDINYEAKLETDVNLANGTLDTCGINDTFKDVTVNLKVRRKRVATYTYYTIDTATFAGCHDNLWFTELSFQFTGLISTLLEDTTSDPLDFQPSDEISFYLEIIVTGTYTQTGAPAIVIPVQNRIIEHGTSYFKITVETTYPATNATVSLVNESLARIVESITDNCMTVYSDYFGRTDALPYTSVADGCGSLECITNGLFIRRKADAIHTISFKQLYDGLNAIHNLGMGIEENSFGYSLDIVRIEPSRYFYDDTVILTLDKVPSIIRTVITDEHFSIFEFGYSKWEAEEFNGLDEFNTKRKYRTSLQSVKNTLTKVCELIASGYAIEVTRQQYSSTSKDWRYDNDDFIICLARGYGGGFEVEQGNIVSPANLIDPDSVYNFRISPVRNALRWLNKLLASYIDPVTSDGLIFMSGEGNILAEGQLTDGCFEENTVISESEEALLLSLLSDTTEGTPIYKPELWEFEYPMSVADYQLVKANPRGIITVRYGQQAEFTECYIREIEYKPNEGIATFMLLPKFSEAAEFLLQESGDELLQEDGDFIILN